MVSMLHGSCISLLLLNVDRILNIVRGLTEAGMMIVMMEGKLNMILGYLLITLRNYYEVLMLRSIRFVCSYRL